MVSVGDAEELSEASHLHGLLSVSAISVQDSQAYRNMDMTRECISLFFELSAIFLSFQMVLSFPVEYLPKLDALIHRTTICLQDTLD